MGAKYWKKCSTTPKVWGMQIILQNYYYSLHICKSFLKPHSTKNWQGCGKMGFFSTAGGERNRHIYFGVISNTQLADCECPVHSEPASCF